MNFNLLIVILLAINTPLFAQTDNNVSFISGTIIDKNSETPLENVHVEILNLIPIKSDFTDQEGHFKLEGVQLGRYRLLVTKEGYEQTIITDVIVSAGSGLIENIALDEAIVEATSLPFKRRKKVTKTNKDKPNNSMAGISARPFTIEEVMRYAGSRNDPARLVTNYAGASGYDDSRNDIIINGNSPAGVQWLIEELPIENPNHISTIGTTGGITPILNTYALANSDFMTGAFAAQYGNTTAGVFDLSLRNGNSSQFGLIGVVGTQRAEFLAEGPFGKKKNNGSFLVSIRASLGNFIFKNIFPVDPEYQDINFKLNFGKKKFGEFEVFGIGGRSRLHIPVQEVTFLDKVRYDIFEDEEYNHENWMGLLGLKYTGFLSEKTFWRTIVGSTLHYNKVRWVYNEEVAPDEIYRETTYSIDNIRLNYMLHSYLTSKLHRTLTIRGGAMVNYHDLNLYEYYDLEQQVDTDFKGGMALVRAYVQAKYRPLSQLTIHLGVSSQYLTLTNQIVAEPRFALNWEMVPNHTISIGYGWHHQMQNHLTFFSTPVIGTDSSGMPIASYENRKLGFSSSHHFVFEYNWLIAQSWRLKLHAYAQLLDQFPVEVEPSVYSDINEGASFYSGYTSDLKNEGKGRNMGINLTIEKFFSMGYYGLLSGSFFTSNYTGSDGLWRRTIFNNMYIVNLLFGKEFKFGKRKQHAVFADIKLSTMGGRPYTPIDVEATFNSFLAGDEEVVYQENQTNNQTLNPFYQVDFKVGFRLTTGKIVHTIKADFFNIANIQNPFAVRYSQAFDPFHATQQIQGNEEVIYQRGFIPDITYIIQF